MEPNHYHTQLKTLGLTKSQITVYLFLLKNGISTPPTIAQATGIARTNCYHILTDLLRQNLISAHTKNRRKTYLARDPESLLYTLAQKKQAVEEMIPDLRSLYTTQKNKPSVQFYEGWEEVQQIYWESTSAREIYAIGSTKRLVEIDAGFFKKFEARLLERKVVLNDLVTHDSARIAAEETAVILKGLYSYNLLPAQKEPVSTDILIWDDHIALITLEEPIFGTVLTNPQLARTFLFFFRLIKGGL